MHFGPIGYLPAMVACSLLPILAYVAYAPILGYPLSTGDTLPLLSGLRLEEWRDLGLLFTTRLLEGTDFHGNFYRPVALLSLAVDQWFHGAEPQGYYITNVVIHAGCGLLVYRCGYELFHDRAIAVLAAALFVIHPLGVELVPSIARRQDLLACFFTLCSVALIVRWRDGRQLRWLMLAGIAYFAALSSKEVAVYIPALLGSILLVPKAAVGGEPRPARQNRGAWIRFALWFTAVLAFYLLVREHVVGGVEGYGDPFSLMRSVNMVLSAADHLFLPGVWQALLGSPPDWSDGRVFLASSAIPVGVFLLAWVWQGTASGEHRTRLAIVLWALLPLAVCIATSTFALRSLYSALPPACLLLACALVRMCTGLRVEGQVEAGGVRWGRTALGVSAAAFITLQGMFSPLFHRYDHWRFSSEAFAELETLLERELPCEALAGIESLNLRGVASFKQFYRTKVPSARSVSYFRKYVLVAWFEEHGCPVAIGDLQFEERDPTSGQTTLAGLRRAGSTLEVDLGWTRALR